jgi:hypothetical protein
MDIMGYSEIVKPRPYMTPCVRTSVLRVVAKEPAIRPRRQRDPAFAISATLAYSLEPAVNVQPIHTILRLHLANRLIKGMIIGAAMYVRPEATVPMTET